MSLAALEKWFTARLPQTAASLNPAATQQALDELSAVTGLQLPEGLVSLYRWHDGQARAGANGLFYGLRFLSLAEMRQQWAAASPPASDAGEIIKAGPARRGWLPFASDAHGHCLAVDLDPGPNGWYGQVINCGAAAEPQFVLAVDILQFMQWLQEQLEDGNFKVFTHPDGGHVFGILQPPAANFIAAARALFGPQEESPGPLRDSVPGVVEVIRALLSARAPGWGKLFIKAQATESALTAQCEYSLRGSDARHSLDAGSELTAAVLELRERMKAEMGLAWQQIQLEYDADEEYSVSIDTT